MSPKGARPNLTQKYLVLKTHQTGSSDASLFFEEAKKQTIRIFSAIGEGCKEILRLFYFEKRSMSEIAEIMGHKSEAVSRTTKKRCLEKIRSEVKEPLSDG